MKVIEINELNNATARLLKGFVKTNLLYQHIKEVRTNYRDTLLKQMKIDGFKETLKIIDDLNKLLTQILWSGNSEDFYQISITLFKFLKVEMKPMISMKVREVIPIQLLSKFKTSKNKKGSL
jgi:plasmid maintenance system killer protein